FEVSTHFGGRGTGAPLAFLTSPQVCEGNASTASLPPLTSVLAADAWGATTSPASYSSALPPATECRLLSFHPSIAISPDSSQAGAPTGYAFELQVPQNEEPEGLATPDVQDVTV